MNSTREESAGCRVAEVAKTALSCLANTVDHVAQMTSLRAKARAEGCSCV